MCAYLYISEISNSNDTKDRREELGLLYYKVLTQPVKWYSVIWKLTSISCLCILQTLVQPLKKISKHV